MSVIDPHLTLALMAGMLTQEEVDGYKAGGDNYKFVRDIAKNGNYACQYGAYPPRLDEIAVERRRQAEVLEEPEVMKLAEGKSSKTEAELRHECAVSGRHDHDGCDCSAEELARRAALAPAKAEEECTDCGGTGVIERENGFYSEECPECAAHPSPTRAEVLEEPEAMKLLRGPLSRRATSAEFNEWQARDIVDYVDRLRALGEKP